MNPLGTTLASWLLHTAVGGGTILLLTTVLARWTRQPARRQRLGELGLAAALVVAVLSLGPSWLHVATDWAGPPPANPVHAPSNFPSLAARTAPPAAAGGEGLDGLLSDDEMVPEPETTPASVAVPDGDNAEELSLQILAGWIVAGFSLGAGVLLLRWLVGHLALARLLRQAGPAPVAVARLFDVVVGQRRRRPRLLVSPQLRVPISCGLWRPAVVLPARLCTAPQRVLRWVFAHELTHLERHDAWSCWLFGLGQALYYYLPWFWGLRRQVRLCQEYVADAAATERGGAAADYAEFLLSLTRRPALPVGATGVSGHASDLYRRVTMLLQDPMCVEKRCPRHWTLAAAGGLLSLAVLASGIGLSGPTRAAAEEPDKKEIRVIIVPADAKKEEARKHVDIKIIRVPANQIQGLMRGQDPSGTPPRKEDSKAKQKEPRPGQVKIYRTRELLGLKMLDPSAVVELNPGLQVQVGKLLNEIGMRGQNSDPAQAQKDLTRVLGQLNAQLAQIKVSDGSSDADIQKEIAKAIDQIRAQQAKLEQLHKVLAARRQAAARFNRPGEARLGVRVSAPSAALADQLDLPKGQGLVVEEVLPGSAAAKAGLKVNDVLLELDGKPVPSDHTGLVKLLAVIKPDAPVNVVVLRKGKKEGIKGLTLAGPATGETSPHVIRWQFQEIPKGPVGFWKKFPDPMVRGANAIRTTVVRTDEKFTTQYQEGTLTITVTGSLAGGKPTVTSVEVQDGGAGARYESLDKVPDKYQARVKQLIGISAKGQIDLDRKTP
jgi:beta-lactamase regulating signal transducer with metallopeptidase domain